MIAPPHASRSLVAPAILLALVVACCRPALAIDFAAERQRMVDEEIAAAGVRNARVLASMRDTPRHEFVPVHERRYAYYDMALAIGNGQTISPPFIVAYMTEQLQPQATDKVLEIGTGSGYQAAVLSPLVKEVYTIEIVEPLGRRAARTLKRLKYENVHAKVGDGYQGWPEHAPFDKIIVTCSPENVPQALVDQLRDGGRMIVPLGERYQQSLYLFQKKEGKLTKEALLPVLFVPMTGRAEERREVQPDPSHPQLVNGDFEKLAVAAASDGTPPAAAPPLDAAQGQQPEPDEAGPDGWYYQRQLKLAEEGAPQGERYVTFSNSEPGRGAQALQGLAVDGREVRELEVSLWIKAQDIRPGATASEQAAIGIMFYDDNRAQIGYTFVGPWRDTFDWRRVSEKVRVPTKAREAIVRIGLGGATGELSLDDVRISRAGN